MARVLYAASDRSSSTAPGRTTRHSFSFGGHYDPANLGFGPMVCHNDDDLAPGGGYPDHPHTDLEVVTWVLEGALVHTGSTGERHVLEAGRAQVLSAGSGVRHAEVADPAAGRCRFVQTWLAPTVPGGPPSYAAGAAPGAYDGLVEVVGGSGLPVGTVGARLLVARLAAGEVVTLPEGPRQHVFVATGSAVVGGVVGSMVGGVSAGTGDALRITDEPGQEVRATAPTELLVWAFA